MKLKDDELNQVAGGADSDMYYSGKRLEYTKLQF